MEGELQDLPFFMSNFCPSDNNLMPRIKKKKKTVSIPISVSRFLI